MKYLLTLILAEMIMTRLGVPCYLLWSQSFKIEDFDGPYDILEELKTMSQTQAYSERYAIPEKFFNYKMEEGSSVSEHAIKMSGYTQRLGQLDCKIPEELKIDKVLQSLPPS
jgi:hypothetical protein